jgi:hypothetical protein
VAGNALDGEFYGPGSASGNGIPGGDFIANFNNYHNITNPPATVIGIPHPNDPPASFQTKKHTAGATHRSKHVVIHKTAASKPKSAAPAQPTTNQPTSGAVVDGAIQSLFGF